MKCTGGWFNTPAARAASNRELGHTLKENRIPSRASSCKRGGHARGVFSAFVYLSELHLAPLALQVVLALSASDRAARGEVTKWVKGVKSEANEKKSSKM